MQSLTQNLVTSQYQLLLHVSPSHGASEASIMYHNTWINNNTFYLQQLRDLLFQLTVLLLTKQ